MFEFYSIVQQRRLYIACINFNIVHIKSIHKRLKISVPYGKSTNKRVFYSTTTKNEYNLDCKCLTYTTAEENITILQFGNIERE